MKTKEANIPWDPKPEDQKFDGKLFKDGVDQLGLERLELATHKRIIHEVLMFQTTVGQILCERELTKFGKSQIFYICFSQLSSGEGLREWLGKTDRVTFLNRQECSERFNIEDGDDNIRIIEKTIEQVPADTALFFDEVPLASRIVGSKTSYDWSSLENRRPEEVTVVVSLQPLLLTPTIKARPRNVIGPRNADIIELTNQYRNTVNISRFVNQLCQEELPVEYADIKISSSHDIQGPEVKVVFLANHNLTGRLRVWLFNQLHEELACERSSKYTRVVARS